MPVYIFIEQIAERFGSASIAGLRAKGAKPHIVTGLDLDPILIQMINSLST
jgi:hypothetical protein